VRGRAELCRWIVLDAVEALSSPSTFSSPTVTSSMDSWYGGDLPPTSITCCPTWFLPLRL
jgi:hypothetical protein